MGVFMLWNTTIACQNYDKAQVHPEPEQEELIAITSDSITIPSRQKFIQLNEVNWHAIKEKYQTRARVNELVIDAPEMENFTLSKLKTLTRLDLSRCIHLTTIELDELDMLKSIDLRNCTRLNRITLKNVYALDYIDLYGLPNLKYIELEECGLDEYLLKMGWSPEATNSSVFVKNSHSFNQYFSMCNLIKGLFIGSALFLGCSQLGLTPWTGTDLSNRLAETNQWLSNSSILNTNIYSINISKIQEKLYFPSFTTTISKKETQCEAGSWKEFLNLSNQSLLDDFLEEPHQMNVSKLQVGKNELGGDIVFNKQHFRKLMNYIHRPFLDELSIHAQSLTSVYLSGDYSDLKVLDMRRCKHLKKLTFSQRVDDLEKNLVR